MPAAGVEHPPFLPGQYMAARVSGATTEANLIGQEYEGKEYWFLDYNWAASDSVKPLRSTMPRKLRVVRNCSGYTLYGKRLCHLGLGADGGVNHAGYGTASAYTAIQPTKGISALNRVSGFARLSNAQAYPMDEFLPSTGVPHGALFYIVIEGPAICQTDGADLVVGDILGPVATLTTEVATNSASNGGRLTTGQALTTTALALSGHRFMLGQVLSTAITNAGDDVLVNVRIMF